MTTSNGYGLPAGVGDMEEVEVMEELLQAANPMTMAGDFVGMIMEGGEAVVGAVQENGLTVIPDLSGRPTIGVEATRPKPSIDLIVRHMLVNPDHSMAQIARVFGVSSGWMYTVTNSDFFRVKYNALLKELDKEHLLPTLHQRIVGMAHRSLDRLSSHVDSASPELALDIYKAMARTVAPPPTGPATIINNHNNSQTLLSIDARSAAITASRTRMLEQAKKQIANG